MLTQFEHDKEKSSTDNDFPELSSMQTEILKQYWELQFLPNFQSFIETAPAEPNLKFLRAHLIKLSLTTMPMHYEKVLLQFYPEVSSEARTYDQNVFLRELLTSFNKMCQGKLDTSHEFYRMVFDPRLSPSPLSSPTKKNLTAMFFRVKVTEFLAKENYSDEALETDPFVSEAMKYERSCSSVRRKLF